MNNILINSASNKNKASERRRKIILSKKYKVKWISWQFQFLSQDIWDLAMLLQSPRRVIRYIYVKLLSISLPLPQPSLLSTARAGTLGWHCAGPHGGSLVRPAATVDRCKSQEHAGEATLLRSVSWSTYSVQCVTWHPIVQCLETLILFSVSWSISSVQCVLNQLGKHFLTYRHFCTPFLGFHGKCWKVTILIFLMEGWTFVGI